MCKWKYQTSESEKVILEGKTYNIETSEKTRIYHHSILQAKIKRSYISKLDTVQGWMVSQTECANFLEGEVRELLSKVHTGDEECMNDLLNEVSECVTDEDNEMLSKKPDMEEIKQVIATSNLKSAPGIDGIPVMFYYVCWDIIGESLVEVIEAIHEGRHPT